MHEGDSRPVGSLTDPWSTSFTKPVPTRWWRPPAAVLLGTVGLLIASRSIRQALVMVALGAIVAAVLFVAARPSILTALIRVGVLTGAAVLARPAIGGRQLILTVACVGLASFALGARPERRDGPAPDITSLAIAPLVAAQVVALRQGPGIVLAALLIIAVATVILGRARPSALDQAKRGFARGVRTLVSVVGAVILFPVVLVCLYLPGALVRLAGAARAATVSGEPSPWKPYGIGLSDEQIDASRPFASTPRPLRVRRHLTGAAVVAVVAVISGIVIVRARQPEAPAPQGFTRSSATPGTGPTTSAGGRPVKTPFAAEFAAPYSSLPAYRDVPWADELQAQEGYSPEISTRWVNVHDHVRASLPPPACACKKLKVWFAGGSAAFGYGQRDQHTIAAELVRLGEASGISIDMENIARAGSALAEEIPQIRDRLEKEDPPDLIVFFEGFNDGLYTTAVKFGESQGTDAGATRNGLEALEYIRAHPEEYLSSDVGPAAGQDALANYRARRAEMMELARSRGIATAWFFQPDAFVSAQQLEGYEEVTNVTPEEFMASPLAVALDHMARGLAADGVTNLRPLFERHPEPVFLGVVHQTEDGAAITAEAIYDDLEDEIARLAS